MKGSATSRKTNVIPFPKRKASVGFGGGRSASFSVLLVRWLALVFCLAVWSAPFVAWHFGGLWGLLAFLGGGALFALGLVVGSRGTR